MLHFFFFLMIRPPPRPPLFPYTPLSRSQEAARFGMSLAQIGLAPSWFLAKKLLEVAGPVTTRRILLLGDPLPAERLFELGVISHIAEPADLETIAAAVIHRISENAPLSLKTMKALIVRG